MLIIVALAASAPFIKSNESAILPSHIVIYDDGRMESMSENFHWVQRIDQIKEIIDWGDWYQIVFLPSSKNLRFICQKDLISYGSLADFENLFQGKIVRRN